MEKGKSDIIIELGAEGGSLTLYGLRTERGWSFSLNTSDWTRELIDEEPIQKRSGVVDSWDAALGLLDRYRYWPELYPISIHPDFKQQVWEAVQKRRRNPDRPWLEDRWLTLLGVIDTTGR